MTAFSSYHLREACVVDYDEDTLYVEPHGNCTFFNNFARDDEHKFGNVSTVERDGETLIKINIL